MTNDNPTLERLLQQKEALYARTDLDADEKDRLARRLRREIRKVRGGPAPKDPASGTTTRRKRSAHGQAVRGEIRLASDNPDEFSQFKAEVQEFLTDLGLDWRDPSSLLQDSAPAYGLDFVYLYEHDVTGEQLIDKFRTRWANKEPKWFSVNGVDAGEILLLGPLPSGMVN